MTHLQPKPKPRTEFDWAIYAYATAAGLSVLIPIPVVDWLFEEFFRRRIPGSIAKRRERVLPAEVISELNRGSGEGGCLKSCVALPIWAVWELIKRLSRKILYVLTVKEASDKISLYWHQAFLMDYMLLQGHLETAESATVARQSMGKLLAGFTTSPLHNLAAQVIAGSRHIFWTLRNFRRGNDDELMEQTQANMKQHWADYAGYFRALAALYDQTYQEQLRLLNEKVD